MKNIPMQRDMPTGVVVPWPEKNTGRISQFDHAPELVIDKNLSLTPDHCIARALENSSYRADVRSFVRHWDSLRQSTVRAAMLVTDLVPGEDPSRSLLQEALEAAALGYLSASPGAVDGSSLARFFASLVSKLTRGLLGQAIVAHHGDGQSMRWDPMRGAMAHLVTSQDIVRLTFPMRSLPSQEERFAMKGWIVSATMRFDDLVVMERAGIDFRTYEAI